MLRKVKRRAAPQAVAKPPEKQYTFVAAGRAERHKKYVEWSGSARLVVVGDAPDSAGGWRQVRVRACDIQGNDMDYNVAESYPLMVDDEMAERIEAEYGRKKRKFAKRDEGVPSKTRRPVVQDGEVPRKNKVTPVRGPVSAKTSYAEGTDGHRFGLLMLAAGCQRQKAVSAIADALRERGGRDEKGCKSLAQSWVSTLIRKRPDIYKR